MTERPAVPPAARPRLVPLSALVTRPAPAAERPRRVLFGESFDPPPPPPAAAPEPEIIAPSFTLEDLELARADAFAEGRKAGMAEAQASVAARHSAALEACVTAIGESVAEARRAADATVAALGRAVFDSFATLLPNSAQTLLADRVERLVGELRASLGAEVALLVRAAPDVADAIASALERVRHREGPTLPTKLEVDSSLPATAVRIAWSSAEAEIDLATVAEALRRILADLLPNSPATTLNAE